MPRATRAPGPPPRPRGGLVADDRVLTGKGKGGRERLVPLNDAARNALAAHIAAVEEDEANGRTKSPWLFPSSGGEHLTRQRFGQEIKALEIAARHAPGRRPTHLR